MNKFQKLGAVVMSAAMLTLSLASAAHAWSPIDTVSATSTVGTVNSYDLGVQYGEYLGLGDNDIRATIASIIKTAMGLLGIVAVVIILIGGFTWMTAGGNDDKVAEAKKWIYAGIIGLAIILSAYALSTFVINSLISATTDTMPPLPAA